MNRGKLTFCIDGAGEVDIDWHNVDSNTFRFLVSRADTPSSSYGAYSSFGCSFTKVYLPVI